MASGVLTPRSPGKPRVRPERALRLWPVAALLLVIVAGRVKSAGLSSLGGVDLTVLGMLILLAVATVTILRRPRYPLGKLLPFIIFALVVLVGVARSDPGDYQALKVRDFLLTSVVVLCIPVLLRDTRDLRGLIATWLVAGMLAATLVLVVGGSEELYGRAGIGQDTLGAAYLSAAALVVGAASLGERLLPLWIALPGTAAGGVALIMVGSRGPMVGAVVALACWMLLRGALRGRSLVVLLVVSVVALVGVRQASGVAIARLAGFGEDPVREQLWAAAGTAFFEAPFLGLGWGDFSTFYGFDVYPHNLFLETAAELGILGLSALLLLLVVAFVRVLQSRSAPEVRVLAALAVLMLVGQQFSGDLTERVFWIALIPCLLLPLRGDSKREDASSGDVARRPTRHVTRPVVRGPMV